MREYLDVIARSALFDRIAKDEISSLLKCLGGERRSYERDEYVIRVGEKVSSLGLVLRGSVNVSNEDFWGRRTIIAKLSPSDLFAEAFACAQVNEMPMDVTASESSEVLFLDFTKLITTCQDTCGFHKRLVENMMKVLAYKNVFLMQKVEHVTRRNTREKLLSYLSSQALKSGCSSFDIPFDRQELADYLAVDRSAMSAELARMKNEGLLKFKHNHFELMR